MAGFDFSIGKHVIGEPLQRGLLRLIQSDARDLGLEFRYWSRGGEFWGVLDGPLPLMYGLRAYLDDDLPTYAIGASRPPDRRQRRRLAAALLRAFDAGLGRITDAIHNELVSVWGDAGFEAVPHSIIFDCGSRSHLAHILRSLTSTLILDIQGRVSRQAAIEESHTVLENLLRTLLGHGARTKSFAEMVDEVAASGHISAAQAVDVKRLNELRRDAKHRAQGFDDDEAGRLLQVAVIVIQRLLSRIRA